MKHTMRKWIYGFLIGLGVLLVLFLGAFVGLEYVLIRENGVNQSLKVEGISDAENLRFSRVKTHYLFTVSLNKKKIMVTSYKDNKGKLRVLKVLVGGTYQGINLSLAPLKINNGEYFRPEELSDYRRRLKFGQIIEVAYIYSTKYLGRSGIETCGSSPHVCETADIVVKNEDQITSFFNQNEQSVNIYLPALFISLVPREIYD